MNWRSDSRRHIRLPGRIPAADDPDGTAGWTG
jgi:hypothetical protein